MPDGGLRSCVSQSCNQGTVTITAPTTAESLVKAYETSLGTVGTVGCASVPVLVPNDKDSNAYCDDKECKEYPWNPSLALFAFINYTEEEHMYI